MQVNFKYVGRDDSFYTPFHAKDGDSGCDLRNASGKVIELHPQGAVMISTGICMEIPAGYEGQLRPRSGLSVKKQIIMLPSVGTIDSGYRGEIKATFYNPTNKIVYIDKDERIAQLVVAPYIKCEYKHKNELGETERGSGGFGSTGQ